RPPVRTPHRARTEPERPVRGERTAGASEFRAEEPGRAGGEQFTSVVGDADGVFALGRQGFVTGDRSPAVGEDLHVRLAQVHHRLDREEHALLQGRPLAAAAIVQDVGAVVEDAADAVAAEVADDRHAIGLDHLLDGVADVAEGGARLDDRQTGLEGIVGDVDQLARAGVEVSDRIHAAGVAVPAVDDDGVVDVDDVAGLENLVPRNAGADDVVDRGADGLLVALVAEAGGQAAVVEGELADAVVDLAGGDAGPDVFGDHVERLGDQTAGLAHALEGLVVVDADFVGADEGVAVQFGGLVHGRLSATGGRHEWANPARRREV